MLLSVVRERFLSHITHTKAFMRLARSGNALRWPSRNDSSEVAPRLRSTHPKGVLQWREYAVDARRRGSHRLQPSGAIAPCLALDSAVADAFDSGRLGVDSDDTIVRWNPTI
jgi:hypothetical protein